MSDPKTVRKEILFLMVPLILENFLQLLTNFIAVAMVGRLEPIDVSAQGMGTKITDFAFYLFRGVGTAMVVLIAKYNARRETAECRYIFDQTAKSLIVLGSFLAAVFLIMPDLLLKCFTDDEQLIAWAVPYLRILACCLPFWAIMMAVSSVFQAIGDTRTPMLMAVGINIINLVLCWALIFGHLGFPALGFLGAAISLTCSRIIGCSVSLMILFNRKVGVFDFRAKSKPVNHVLKEVYSIGVPAAGEAIVWQLSSILLSRAILSYGANAFAAYQLGVQAEYITEIPAIGFSVASTSLISKAIGLRDKELFLTYKRETIRICVYISIATSSLLILLPGQFMQLLTSHRELIEIGCAYVVIMGLIQIPQNLIKVYAGILRSTGSKNIPVTIEAIGTWGFRIPAALLCAYILNLPIMSIWICIAIDQAGKFFFSSGYTERRLKKSNILDFTH